LHDALAMLFRPVQPAHILRMAHQEAPVDIIQRRGAGTKGRAAKAVAGCDNVEIKATVPPQQVAHAMERFGLHADNDEERFIYFFDTPDLALFGSGIVARARRRIGGKHDSTMKFRPVEPDQVPDRWRQLEGFKLEADASDRNVVRSASLTMPVRKGLIKQVAAGEAPIGTLFTESQINFLLSLADRRFDPSAVVVLGPVEAFRWKFEDPALPWPLSAELWRRPDGEEIMELSVKAPAIQAAVFYFGFMAFLAELGTERDANQQAKTRWALEFFAQRYDPAARSPETVDQQAVTQAAVADGKGVTA
jgi:hypothetical protein